MARSLNEWFAAYSVSHQNQTNKKIHFVCVPAIYWSIVGLFWAIPWPAAWGGLPPWVNWSAVVLLVSVAFYARLSALITLLMASFCALSIGSFWAFELASPGSPLPIALTVFIVAWAGQFIGHKIEGKKPSFFQDLQFLMIGPAWVMGFLLERLGVRSMSPGRPT